MQVARGDSRVQASPSEPQVDSLPSRASLLLRLGRSASFGAADGPHRSAAAAAAEVGVAAIGLEPRRSEEHTSELQSLMRISYAVFCLKKKTTTNKPTTHAKAK